MEPNTLVVSYRRNVNEHRSFRSLPGHVIHGIKYALIKFSVVEI